MTGRSFAGPLASLIVACLVVGACARPSGTSTPPPSGGPPDGSAGLDAGDHGFSMTVDGRSRTYLLHVPPEGTAVDETTSSGAARPRPLVVELHGGGGRASTMEALTGLITATDARGWLVAAPDGIDRQWNDGRPTIGAAVDDVAFIRALIDDVANRTPVDRSRVFATGISNGAMMSGRIACELADRIVAVAQVAGTLGIGEAARCSPSRPVSVLVIAGTADPLVPYAGGSVGAGLGLSRGTVVGAEQYVSDWLGRDAIASTSRTLTRMPPDTVVASYGAEDGGPRVVFYGVEGGGHTWPGGLQYLPKFLVGSTTRTFNASRVIVDFFASLSAG